MPAAVVALVQWNGQGHPSTEGCTRRVLDFLGDAQYPPFDEPQAEDFYELPEELADELRAIEAPIRIRLKVHIHQGEPFVAVGVGAQQGSIMVCLMHDELESALIMMPFEQWNALPQYYFTSGTKESTKTDFKYKPPEQNSGD